MYQPFSKSMTSCSHFPHTQPKFGAVSKSTRRIFASGPLTGFFFISHGAHTFLVADEHPYQAFGSLGPTAPTTGTSICLSVLEAKLIPSCVSAALIATLRIIGQS